MAMQQDCIDLIRQGVGQGMTDDELVSLFEEVKKTRQELAKSREKVSDMDAALQEAVAENADRMAVEAIAKKRALAMQATTRLKAVDYVLVNWRGNEADGLMSLLGGTNYAKAGSRLSIDAMQTSLHGHYVGGLLADLQALGDGPFRLFRKGKLDREISRALESLDTPNAGKYEGPDEALAVAKVLHKWQEQARMDQNRAGAWIGKLPGYIVRQSHDRGKIKRAGFDVWAREIEQRLDWEKTAGEFEPGPRGPEARREFLQEVYKHIVTGVRGDTTPNSLTAAPVIGNVAAKASKERVLHFKDADAWFDYNQQFGTGSLREAVLYGLQRAAQTTGLMRALGPAPQVNFDSVFRDVQNALDRAGDIEGAERLNSRRKAMNNLLKEVDGTINAEGSPTLAAVGRTWRALENITKLGGAVLSAITDAPVFSAEMAWQGRGFFSSLGEGMVSLTKGRGTAEQQRILSSLGVFFDGMCGDIAARFTGEDMPGKMSWLQNVFFKLNALTWWTDSWRRAAGLMLAHDLALERTLPWEQLSKERRRVLDLYNIGADEWDIIRAGDVAGADGREYLTPDALASASTRQLADYLVKRGRRADANSIDDLRFDLTQRLRTFYRDRIDYAVLQPDARTRGILRQGTSAGTAPGEAMRFVTQFKSFPVAFLQKVWGRELLGRGAESLAQGFKNEHGELNNLVRLMLMVTLFGYGSMAAKDMAKGRTPRDPSDYKTWIAAASQGGGIGIMGDFLFGEANRMGGGIISSMIGPAAGTVEELHGLYARVRDGDTVAQAALRFALNHTPGSNLFYLRPFFDYLAGYNLFEMMNPGYFERMRRRVERENNQQIWLRPVNW